MSMGYATPWRSKEKKVRKIKKANQSDLDSVRGGAEIEDNNGSTDGALFFVVEDPVINALVAKGGRLDAMPSSLVEKLRLSRKEAAKKELTAVSEKGGSDGRVSTRQ